MAPPLFDSHNRPCTCTYTVPGLCAFCACKEETSSIDRRERPGGWRYAVNGLLCLRNSPWSLPWECIDRWVTSALPRPLLLLLLLFSSALVPGTTNEYPPAALILGTNWIELMVSGCCPAGCVSFHPLDWTEPKRSECYAMLLCKPLVALFTRKVTIIHRGFAFALFCSSTASAQLLILVTHCNITQCLSTGGSFVSSNFIFAFDLNACWPIENHKPPMPDANAGFQFGNLILRLWTLSLQGKSDGNKTRARILVYCLTKKSFNIPPSHFFSSTSHQKKRKFLTLLCWWERKCLPVRRLWSGSCCVTRVGNVWQRQGGCDTLTSFHSCKCRETWYACLWPKEDITLM